jgi:ribonuclease HI
MICIYTDGASRGNGGESAAAYIILNEDGKELARGVRHIGLATNNMAEYMAVHDAIEYCYLNITFDPSDCFKIISDSTLVINQLNKNWRINNHNLQEIVHNIRFYLDNMGSRFAFEWEPRTNKIIKECDKMNNQCLDSISLITCNHPKARVQASRT